MNKVITWNIINSLLAGSLVFLGALSTGNISWESVYFAFIASGVIAVNQFKDFWKNTEPPEVQPKMFTFIKI